MYQRALKSYLDLLRQQPDNREILAEVGGLYLAIGTILLEIGKLEDAHSHLARSKALLEKVGTDYKSSYDGPNSVAGSSLYLGRVEYTRGRMEEALQNYHEALAIWQNLGRQFPQDKWYNWYRRNEALGHCLIGKVLLAQGRLPDALNHFRKATAIHEVLPDEDRYLWQLAYGLHQTGLALHQTGQLDEALRLLKGARDIQVPLVRDKPDENIWWERDLALVDLALGKVYHSLKDSTEALRCCEKARAAFQRLADENPPVHDLRSGLAEVYLLRGNVLIEQGRRKAGRGDLERTRQLCQRLREDSPAVTKNQRLLAESEEGMAQVHKALGQPEQAQACWQRAGSIWQELAGAHPSVPEFRRGLDRTSKPLGNR
jgi:tetratricopeptide (TPR) repeat protein